MTTPQQRSRLRRAVALPATVALLMMLAACGGDDEQSEQESSADSAPAGSEDSENSDVALPEGFPDDIPLPEGATLKSATAIGDDNGWRLLYVIPVDDDGRRDAYAARLSDAGLQVEETGEVNLTAEREGWRVDAVVRPPTITLQVLRS